MHSLQLNNITFNITRISRSKLDRIFINKRPTPPTTTVVVFGDYEEESYLYTDPSYLEELRAYNSRVYSTEKSLFLNAISYDEDELLKIVDDELYALTGNLLLSALTDKQVYKLFDEVVYISTVTRRGINEAYNILNVTKYEDDITKIVLPVTNIKYSQVYRDMLVAKEANISWKDFCELSGFEQSMLVAFHNLQNILKYLEEKSNGQRK